MVLSQLFSLTSYHVKCINYFSIFKESFKTEGSPSVGEVWSTQSFIKVKYYSTDVVMEYGILFAADVTVQFTVELADLGFQEVIHIIM